MSVRVDTKKIILVLIIVTCVLPKELSLIGFSEALTREYGSVISLTIPMLLMLAFMVLNKGKIYYERKKESPITTWFAWAIISGIFLPITDGAVEYYAVAALRMIMYVIMFTLLTHNISSKSFYEGIDTGFKASLIAQTVIGSLYEFFGILIPIVSNYSDSVRNDMKRMVGSFSHPGDFSLYIAIVTLYFVVRYLYNREKKDIPFIIMGAMDILLSGGRTMLICTAIVSFALLLKKNKKNNLLKVSLVISVAVGMFWFVQSDTFQDLFVKHNFWDMFLARFVHWIVGLKIMLTNPVNFFCGVGLNNCVGYINEHFADFTALLARQTVIDDSFANRSPIHNSYIIAGVETGIIGIILYGRIYVSGILKSFRIMKTNSINKAQGVYLAAAFFTCAVYAMQGWSLQKNYALTMLVVLCAFLYHLDNDSRNDKE